MPLFAQTDDNGTVTRVVVADDIAWLQSRLGGSWVETKDSDRVEQYAGIGLVNDERSQFRFARPWRQPTGASDAYPVGAAVAHNGQIWQNKIPANVWEPGTVGWRDPISEVPKWIQPVGAVDSYELDAVVSHKGKEWQSMVANNVWEPGGPGIGSNIWLDVTEPAPVDDPEWAENTAYRIGDKVTYQGRMYRCRQAHTSLRGWEPPNVPALWLAI